MNSKPPKEFTEQEKKRILDYRASGKSMKFIAKAMRISDKRIAAFIRPIEDKKRKHEINKRIFDKFVVQACSTANESVNEFIASISESQLSHIRNVLGGKLKKEQKKDLHNSLEALFETFLDASMRMAVVAMWTMPAKYKRLWLYNIYEDPCTTPDGRK